jgi:hypothetical protein
MFLFEQLQSCKTLEESGKSADSGVFALSVYPTRGISARFLYQFT